MQSATDAAAEPAADGGRIRGFTIALSTSGCQSGCPTYDLQLDHSGSVLFNGRGHTRQQGWGGKMVSPELAAELLESLNAAGYWTLQDVYREQSDGCSELEAERATYTWNVSTDGPAKIVIDYQGCQGVPELGELRKIPELLTDKLGLQRWLGD
jgi:hypothetical protein